MREEIAVKMMRRDVVEVVKRIEMPQSGSLRRRIIAVVGKISESTDAAGHHDYLKQDERAVETVVEKLEGPVFKVEVENELGLDPGLKS